MSRKMLRPFIIKVIVLRYESIPSPTIKIE